MSGAVQANSVGEGFFTHYMQSGSPRLCNTYYTRPECRVRSRKGLIPLLWLPVFGGMLSPNGPIIAHQLCNYPQQFTLIIRPEDAGAKRGVAEMMSLLPYHTHAP